MERDNVLIIGLGNLGGHVLDMLTRRSPSPKVTVAGRNYPYLHQRANLSTLVAMQLGFNPEVECVEMDVNNIDQTTQTIARVQPSIIFSTLSLQAWWVINELPKPVFEELDEAQIGPWLPMQLTLIYKLMQAVKQSGLDIKVVNAALPDATHAILDKVGLAPTIGVGNVANVIPALRKTVAAKLDKPVTDVQIYFVTEAYVSHRIPRFGNAGGAPFHFTALVRGEDVTDQLDMETLFDLLPTKFKRLGGVTGSVLTAASAMTVIDPMLNDTPSLTHAPGPNGLIGGYPVMITATGGKVVLPNGLSMEEAVRINEACLKFDGIERIEKDGSVVYTEREMSIVKKMLGYECRKMRLEESEERAKELAAKYAEFRDKYR